MTRLAQQMRFLLEVDKLKSVLRRTRLLEPGDAVSRCENSAEHSWHIALMAVVLAEHSNAPIDLPKVLKMLLVHDVVEIDAGDTPAFGEQGNKAEREDAAAARIFGLLPDDQREEFTALWREFDESATPESRFANAVDRLLPPFQNLANLGGTWEEFRVDRAKVDRRLAPIGDGAAAVWDVVRSVLDEGERRGYMQG